MVFLNPLLFHKDCPPDVILFSWNQVREVRKCFGEEIGREMPLCVKRKRAGPLAGMEEEEHEVSQHLGSCFSLSSSWNARSQGRRLGRMWIKPGASRCMLQPPSGLWEHSFPMLAGPSQCEWPPAGRAGVVGTYLLWPLCAIERTRNRHTALGTQKVTELDCSGLPVQRQS